MRNGEMLAAQADKLNIKYDRDILMRGFTTFQIGGPAAFLFQPDTKEKLQCILKSCGETGVKTFILGNGSNLLVSDKGFDGAVVCLTRLNQCAVSGESVIECEAGVSLFSLCRFAADNSLSGLEFAYGIPGTVGGAVYMNAGAYECEIESAVALCNSMDACGNELTRDRSRLSFEYRKSIFMTGGEIITDVVLRLRPGNREEIRAGMESFFNRRKASQPLDYPSAGSVFKRPLNDYAGRLIECCGLKGTKAGGAQVSDKHAGFIVNTGSATSDDVLKLIEIIQEKVFTQTGISLETEIKYLA